jgi:hypothetical protein
MATTTPIYALPIASASDPADGAGNESSMMGATDTALAGLRARKGSDQVVTSSTVLTNDTSLLRPVAINSSYWVKLFWIYQSGATPLVKVGWTAPAGSTFDWTAGALVSTVTAATSGSIDRAALTLASSKVLGVDGATSLVALIEGWLITSSTAGNLQFQFAQSVSDPGSTTSKAGSTLWLRKTS